MQRASIRKKIQEWYKLAAAGGIFWGLAAALFDLMMRGSPIGQLYIGMLSTVTTPLYARMAELTTDSPLVLWLFNSITTIVYLLVGYGVKITSSALSSVWAVLFQKITNK